MDAFTNGIIDGFKQWKPYSDVLLILTELPTDWQIKISCR
jgi:hypothetical protein